MALKWIFPMVLVLVTNICCEPNNEHHMQTRGLSDTNICRFDILTGTFEDQKTPENYFPDMEFPSDILEVGKPYYFKATDDAVLEPFPRDVKESFKRISLTGKSGEKTERKELTHAAPKTNGDGHTILLKQKDTAPVTKDTLVASNEEKTNNVTYVEENAESILNSNETSTEFLDSVENAHSDNDTVTFFENGFREIGEDLTLSTSE